MAVTKRQWARVTPQGIFIGLLVLGLIACLAWGFTEARQRGIRNACVANLAQIDGAKCSISLEQKIRSRERVDWDRVGLANYLKGMVLPVCPAGGTYDVGATVEELPRCSIAGHALSQHVKMYRE